MSTSNIIRLPIIVEGLEIADTGAGYHQIAYENGVVVEIPKLSPAIEAQLVARRTPPLADVHLDDITIFLEQVGKLWSDRAFPLHRDAVRLASMATGMSVHLLEEDYQRIGRALTRGKLYDLVEADLGTSLSMDDWVPRQSIYERAVPCGRVLHLMVGNVPLAGLFTVTRSTLTKNVTLAKLPSRDPVSCLYFARTFLHVDPEHPVSKSLSIVYWPGGADVEARMIAGADLVCAWGQGSSIDSVKRNVPQGVDFMEFGPKESLLLVRYVEADADDVCMRAAYDISVYDQEACFSPQRVFVEGDALAFCGKLAHWMKQMERRLPPGSRAVDGMAHVNRARLEARFEGVEVFGDEELHWTVIHAPQVELVSDHPLCRTIYVHPVASLREVFAFMHKDVQTIGVSPWSEAQNLGAELAMRGAARICEVGLVSRPRPGFTHDCYKPLQRMVRWVSLERGLDYKGKFRSSSAEEFRNGLFRAGAG